MPRAMLHADLLLTGGNLITLDDARPRASALAARDGRIVREVDLVGSTCVDDVLGRLSQLAARRTEGWLRGHGFDQDKLAERRFPTRADLDRVSPDRPII